MALINNSKEFIEYELKRNIVINDIIDLKKQLHNLVLKNKPDKKIAKINFNTKMGVINSVFFNNNNNLKIECMPLAVMQNYSNLLYSVLNNSSYSSDYIVSKIALNFRNLAKETCNDKFPEETILSAVKNNFANLNAYCKIINRDYLDFNKISIHGDFSAFYNNYLLTENIKDKFNNEVNHEIIKIENGYEEDRKNILKTSIKSDIAFRLDESAADCTFEKQCAYKEDVNKFMKKTLEIYTTKRDESQLNAIMAKTKK